MCNMNAFNGVSSCRYMRVVYMKNKILKMKKLIVLSFKTMNDAVLAQFATNVYNKLSADAQFAALKPFADDLKVCSHAFDTGVTNAANGGSLLVKEKNRKFDALTNQLSKIAIQVESSAEGDEDVALAAGFDIVKVSKPITELNAPIGVSVFNVERSGSVKLSWTAVDGAINYGIERKETGETVWLNGDYSTARSLILSGLKPGANMTFHIRTLGRRGLVSDWSQEVSVWVA